MADAALRHLSRRSLLRAAGVSAVGAVAVGAGRAAAGPVSALDPGSTTVLNISCDEFLPVNMAPSTAWDYQYWGGLQMNALSPGSYWHAGLHLPLGSTLTGLDLTLDPRNQPGGVVARIMRYRAVPGGSTGAGSPYPGSDFQVLCETATATGLGLTVVSAPAISHVVDELNWNYRITWIYLAAGGAVLFNARVGYTPPASTPAATTTTTQPSTTTEPATTQPATTQPATTQPATTQPPVAAGPTGPVFLSVPVRVYDSRTGVGGPKAPFGSGTTRTISCAAASIPATARGLICNVTATNTVGGGYTVLYPGGSSAPTTSTLNWASGATVANAATVGCGTNATVSLQVQLASADLILDVTGYYP